MKWKRSMLILFLNAFLALIVGTDQGAARELKKVYNLREAVSEALVKNPQYRAKLEEIEQAIQVKNQARTDLLPRLATEYRYTRLRNTVRNFGPAALSVSPDNYAWTTTLTQPLFTGFALLSKYDLAKLGIDLSQIEAELAKLELALRVKVAYFDILIADTGVDVAERDVAARQSNAEVARSFYKVGMIPINELLQAEVELANAQQALVRAQNAAAIARSAFNTILSRPVNAPVDVMVPDPLWEPVRGAFEQYVARALKTRPEMRSIDIQLEQADKTITLEKSKFYPEISLVGTYLKEGDTPDVSGSDFHQARDARATAMLTWTFWEWGKTRYSIKEKESFKKQLLEKRSEVENDIRLEVREALLALDTAEKNIPTTRKAVEQGEENLRVSEERYKAQVTTITEVLDAQTRLTQARVNYFRALYDHHLAKARLFRAMGEY